VSHVHHVFMMHCAALAPCYSHNVCAAALVLLQLVKGDIQSMDLLTFVLQAEEIDTIMHYAAQVRACTSASGCNQAQRLQEACMGSRACMLGTLSKETTATAGSICIQIHVPVCCQASRGSKMALGK
jgi:hypothetical protein